MQKTFSKPNAPYLIPGALATSTLLASGVLAAAPYIGFLAPIAALNVGLPFIIGCALFSFVVVAFSSYKVVQNSASATKETKADNQDQVEPITEVVENSVNEINKDETIEKSQQDQVEPVEGVKAGDKELNQSVESKGNFIDYARKILKEKQPYIDVAVIAACYIAAYGATNYFNQEQLPYQSVPSDVNGAGTKEASLYGTCGPLQDIGNVTALVGPIIDGAFNATKYLSNAASSVLSYVNGTKEDSFYGTCDVTALVEPITNRSF